MSNRDGVGGLYDNRYEGSSYLYEERISIKDKEDFQNGVFVLSGEIDDKGASALIFKVLAFKEQDPQRPMKLYINCDGGSVTAGMAIYDTLCFISNQVSTIAVEKVSGIAALILAAGEKNMRRAYRGTQLSLGHFYAKPYAELGPEVLSTMEKIIELFAKHTGRTVEEIRELIALGAILEPREAIAFGFVDEETED